MEITRSGATKAAEAAAATMTTATTTATTNWTAAAGCNIISNR